MITSTPQCRYHRRSSLPRFESGSSIQFDPKLSIVKFDSKISTDVIPRRPVPIINRLTQVLGPSPKIQLTFHRESSISDSTPDGSHLKKDASRRKSGKIRKRSSMIPKKSFRFNSRKEKRHAIYNQCRRISKVDHAINETYSCAGSSIPYAGSSIQFTSVGTNFGSEYEEIEIRKFQEEINEHNGLLDITVENEQFTDLNKFERFCTNKESNCPFDELLDTIDETPLTLELLEEAPASQQNKNNKVSVTSKKPSFVRTSGTKARVSNHCARMCWNQQKIPQLHKFKAEKREKNDSSENRSSISSGHSSLFMSVTTLHKSVSEAWHELPTFVQYYLIAITICFVSILHYQLSK